MWHPVAVRYYDFCGDGTVIVGLLALACCVLEAESAVAGLDPVEAPGPGAHTVVVIAGTVTDAMAPLVLRAVQAHPGASVVAFGACASAGGPYWDSPVVTKGVDQIVPVHRYLPGCPPSPEALRVALREVADA